MMEFGIAHLLEASIKLECSLEVTTRALFLYHRFMKKMDFYYFDEDLAAASALRISGRVYEQPIDIHSLICVFYSIVNQTHDVLSYEDEEYINLRFNLSDTCWIMVRTVYMDFEKPLAHQYLVPFLMVIFERSKHIAEYRRDLGSTCIRFMNDFYTQRTCLSFPAELIAVACIDLGLYVHGLINDLAMIPAWYMGFVSYVTPDLVKFLKKRIMELYLIPFMTYPRQYLKRKVFDEEILVAESAEEQQPTQAEVQEIEEVPSTQEQQKENEEVCP